MVSDRKRETDDSSISRKPRSLTFHPQRRKPQKQKSQVFPEQASEGPTPALEKALLTGSINWRPWQYLQDVYLSIRTNFFTFYLTCNRLNTTLIVFRVFY